MVLGSKRFPDYTGISEFKRNKYRAPGCSAHFPAMLLWLWRHMISGVGYRVIIEILVMLVSKINPMTSHFSIWLPKTKFSTKDASTGKFIRNKKPLVTIHDIHDFSQTRNQLMSFSKKTWSMPLVPVAVQEPSTSSSKLQHATMRLPKKSLVYSRPRKPRRKRNFRTTSDERWPLENSTILSKGVLKSGKT